jgi:biotin carboxylase
MKYLLADDKSKNIVLYINDFYPEFAAAFTKLSDRLDRALRGIMLIDAERKASGKNRPDKEGFFDEIIVDFSDDVALRKALKPLEDNLLLVSCDSERSQLYFKKVIPHVPNVLTPTERSIDWSTNKGEMRKLLNSYDQTISPSAVVVEDASDGTIARILSHLNFPMIVKPTSLAASILVNKVDSVDELRKTLERSIESINNLYADHRGLGEKTLLVEEYIDGDIYSTDAYIDASGNAYILPFIYCRNGFMVGQEGFQIYDSKTRLMLTDEEIIAGQEVAKKAMYAIGLRSSVAHIELFYTNKNRDWKVIELGARPGGWRQETYDVSYGIDHALNELLVKVGLNPDMPEQIRKHSATFRIHAPVEGVVQSITGIEEAHKHPNMHTLHVDIKPGDKVLPSTHGGSMLVGGLMYNQDSSQLDNQIEAVRNNINVLIK